MPPGKSALRKSELKKSGAKETGLPSKIGSKKRGQKKTGSEKAGASKSAVGSGVRPNNTLAKTPASKKTAKPGYDPLALERVKAILDTLAQTYPKAECALHHRNAWELLVATILSAQCTDARVNMVTPGLFEKFPTLAAFAQASLPEIENEIRSTGFYHNKAKSLSGAARRIVEDFSSKVPGTMQELLSLPGVARKTASVVLGVAFKRAEGIVVDTHVLRLSRRLELTINIDAKRVEQDLMKIIPHERWIDFSHEMILHGRRVCIARKPRCIDCTLEKLCHSSDKTWGATRP
jgi:endonuclease III